MTDPAGESTGQVLRLDFDRRLVLQFRGSVVTSDAGLLACRELDDALGLTTMAGEMLAEARTGRNGRHVLVGLFRQSVFWPSRGIRGRERCRAAAARSGDTLDRGEKVVSGRGESASQMGRFETKWLAVGKNLSAHRRRADGAGCQMGSLSGEHGLCG